MEYFSTLFTFAGGIGMFLYGMNRMADGMQKTAGGKMKSLLGYLTRNRFLAVCVGALITAVIQSSGATTVMVVGFVNAGIMNLVQAVGVIMGANIGTTITAWIVSLGQLGEAAKAFSPSFYAPLLIGIGAFVSIIAKKDKSKIIGEIVVGVGLLFEGLELMSSSVSAYTDAPIFSNAFQVVGSNPLLGILIGIIVTAILQSSSASVGILQTLALNGVVTTNAAIFCIRPDIAVHNITPVEISIFHTLFNIICTTVMFPFAHLLVKISGVIIPEKNEAAEGAEDDIDEAELEISRHFDNRLMSQPAVALESAKSQVIAMAKLAYDNIEYASRAVTENSTELVNVIYKTEKMVDYYTKYLTAYLIKINNLSMTDKQHYVVNNLFHTVIDLERISDHAENFADLTKYKIQNNMMFSDKGNDELRELFSKVLLCLDRTIAARETLDIKAVRDVYRIEDEVDDLEESLRNKHIERLSAGLCAAPNSVTFLDILTNLERVSDHSKNIAECVSEEISSN